MPPHVAAYAAALHHAGLGTWRQVRAAIDLAGMGWYSPATLQRAAVAWARQHVSRAARAALRQHRRMRR